MAGREAAGIHVVRGGRRLLAAGLVAALLAGAAQAGPPPPAYSSPRPPANDPPPRALPGVPPGVIVAAPAPPPPLPVGLRIVYAPFYAAGLVLRYGVYYVLVAPFEVFGRALAFGAEGGVEEPSEAP